MFSADQYRAEVAKYAKFAGQENTPNAVGEFKDLERAFTVLADDAQWLADYHRQRLVGSRDETVCMPDPSVSSTATPLIDLSFSIAPFVAKRNQTAAIQQESKTLVPGEKQLLPRRTGESRFAPPQYFYSASRGGAVPTLTCRNKEAVNPRT